MKKYREDGGSASSTGYSISSAYDGGNHQSIGSSSKNTNTINNSLKKLSELEKLQLLQLQRTREKITKELEHVNQHSSSSAMYPYNHDTTLGIVNGGGGGSSSSSSMSPKVSFFDNESIHSFKSMDIPSSSVSSYHKTHSASSRISRNHRRQQHQLSSSLISPQSSSSSMYNDSGKTMMSRSVNNIKSGTNYYHSHVVIIVLNYYYIYISIILSITSCIYILSVIHITRI